VTASSKMRQRIFFALAVLMMWRGASVLRAQNGFEFKDWKTNLDSPRHTKAHVACNTLASLTGYKFSISNATIVAASGETPEYCRVSGLILPDVRFDVSLPTEWNGRLYMFGNGGFAGESFDAPVRANRRDLALRRGFAVASTNTGHDAAVEPLGTFAANRQELIDYAYLAVHVTATTAKQLVRSYYEQAPLHSYFDGCSTGGRQGLISAQRFPEDFDGIAVGAPILDFSTMISYAWNQKALTAAPIDSEKMKIIAEKVYSKCDGLDGLSDGLIDDPRQCPFSPSTDLPKCAKNVDQPSCFTTAQIQALEMIYGGTKRKGTTFFPGQPVGAEIATETGGAIRSGWVSWQLQGPGGTRGTEDVFGQTFMKYMAFGKPDPNYDWSTFDFETDPDKIQNALALLNASDPDVSRFKGRGGKIVMYFGWADPALNPLMGVHYYEQVDRHFGSATNQFFRLFMVPGMFHCGGGIGVSAFDAMTPLVEWVEKAIPPKSIVGARIVDNRIVRTRPLCPYPQTAKYKGAGSIDDAANFVCSNP